MYKIKTVNKISRSGLDRFDSNLYEIKSENIKDENAIIVRSANLHDYNFSKETQAIARAGAGVNNIPLNICEKEGIIVFNTPGANANAVKELVIASFLIASRHIIDGHEWLLTINRNDNLKKEIEKGKSQFVGSELKGKKAGIIGLGAIGVQVANSLLSLGMDVLGYDPYLSLKNAFNLKNNMEYVKDINQIFRICDYISFHIPLADDNIGLINNNTLSLMKDGVNLFNFSRGELCVDDDLIDSVSKGKVASYSTDFASTPLLNKKNIYIYPHLGASTKESEENCAQLAVDEIRAFLETGEITNSVNMKPVHLDKSGKYRISIVHKNVKNMISKISATVANCESNISELVNKSSGALAYTLIDTNEYHKDLIDKIKKIDGVLKVRRVY